MHDRAHTHTHTRTRPSARPSARLAALAVTAFAAMGLSLGSAAPALAHDELVGSSVEVDVATGAANAITLSFNNDIMDVGTEILVTGPGGSDATDGAPIVAGRDVRQPLAAPLAAGDYDVVWRVVSSDGHPIQGAFALLVSETGEGTLSEAGDPGEEEHEHGDEEHGDEDHGDHDHGDEPEVTTQADGEATAAGQPWWLWALIGIGSAGVVAAVITSAVVGAKRRREAMGGEQGAGESGADENSADESSTDESGADR